MKTRDPTMVRSELYDLILKLNPDFNPRTATSVVRAIFDRISNALVAGDRVELRGFGAFSIRERQARMGRNPLTGTAVSVPAKRAVHFRPGLGLARRLNQRPQETRRQ